MKKLLFVLLLISASAFANTPVSVALDWYINPNHAPLLVAKAQGYFAKEGLDVTFIEPTSATESLQMVATGKATFGIDYQPHVMMAVSQGLPVHVSAKLVNQPLNCVAVLATSRIHSLADLKGETLGYSGGDATLALLKTMLSYHHLALSDVKLVDLNMDLSQALLSGKIAAVDGMMRNVEPVTLKAKDIATHLFYPEDNGVPSYDELVIVAGAQIAPATVTAFNKALARGIRFLKAHPNASWQLAQSQYPQNLAANADEARVNEAIWLASVPYFASASTLQDNKRYEAFNHYLVKSGLLKAPLPFSKYAGL